MKHGDVDGMASEITRIAAMSPQSRGLAGQLAAQALGLHYSERRLKGVLSGLLEAAMRGEAAATVTQPIEPLPARRAA